MSRPPFVAAALIVVACFTLAACDKDPAASVRIADSRPAPPASTAAASAAVAPPPIDADAAAARAASSAPATRPVDASAAAKAKIAAAAAPGAAALADPGWRPPGCPPPAESGPGPSRLNVSGPCSFGHQGRFSCEKIHDDFYISMSRKAANGSTLMIFVNVEKYNGPGDYKTGEMHLSVQDRSSIYRWSSQEVELTVGPDAAFVTLPRTRLEAEPVLVDCTGPMTNYQCSGRGELEALLGTVQILSGRMQCEREAKAQ